MIQEHLHPYLATHPAVTALVSARVYPYALPQRASLPAVVYSVVSGTRVHAHDGFAGLTSTRVRCHCIASTYLGAHQLAEAVTAALDDMAGFARIRSSIVDAPPFDLGFVEETGNYQVAVDATIQHDE